MLNALCRQLIDRYQHGLPLCERPYAVMAETLGCSEQQVIDALRFLGDEGYLSRVGAVFNHTKTGASTLAALAVPQHDIDRVAALVSDYAAVNHNYLRDNAVNLWFVVTASNEAALQDVLNDIESRCGYPLLRLPMLTAYHIDLGFAKNWQMLDHPAGTIQAASL